LEDVIGELDLGGHVHLVGCLADVAQFYCALDVLVSASHTESFGLAIVEAMACGTAVVATETEGAREIIQNGESGLLAPIGGIEALARAVMSLLEDETMRRQLRVCARQAAQKRFSLERMVDATETIYRESLATR